MPKSPVRLRGRPPKLKMPDPIPDSWENVMRTMLRAKPKKPDEWRYMKAIKAESAGKN